MRRSHGPLLLVALVVGAACGGGTEPPGPPTAVVAVSPGPFTGTVGQVLSAPVQVRVTDANARGVPGVAVQFLVTSGNGSVGAGATGGTSYTDSTDQDGVADAMWTLGTVSGMQTATAGVTGVSTITLQAAAAAGPAAGSVVADASAFIAPVSSPTDEPLAVVVQDQYGNAVVGSVVSWAALSAGASVVSGSSTSDADGLAEMGATLGAATGIYLFSATPAGAAPDTIAVIALIVVADPVGDQAPVVNPAYASHDVTRVGAIVLSDFLFLYTGFAGNVSPTTPGSPAQTSMFANYDFDLDGDSLTGIHTWRQCSPFFDAPISFGADAFVLLDSRVIAGEPGVEEGEIPVVRILTTDADRCLYATAEYVPIQPLFYPKSVTVVIPLDFLFQDDGAMSITSLVFHPTTFDSDTVYTDVAPDSLAWDFMATPGVGAAAPAAVVANLWDYLPVRRPEDAVRWRPLPLQVRRKYP